MRSHLFAAVLWILALSLSLPTAHANFSARQGDGTRSLVVPRSGPLKGKELYRRSHALLIGINEYAHLDRGKWLEYAINDMQELRTLLVDRYGFLDENIKVLSNEKATAAAIREALASYADKQTVGDRDRVLIYFAGHGQTVKLPNGGDVGFLLPFDAKVDLDDKGNLAPYLKTCVRMPDVWGYLESSPAKHILLIADACYSGLFAKTRDVTPLSDVALASMADARALQVITAGRAGQVSIEKPELGHGIFTAKLLQELRSGASAAGNLVTATELFGRVQREVTAASNGRQTPQIGNRDTEGEFLFITTESRGTTVVKDAASPLDQGIKLFEAGKYPEAEKELRQAIPLLRGDARCRAYLGRACYAQEKWTDAESAYREASRLEPSSADYRYNVATTLYQQKKYAEAEPFYRAAILLDAKESRYHQGLGNVLYYGYSKYGDAEAIYREAVLVDKSNAFSHNQLGNALYSQGKFVEAEAEYREAIRLSGGKTAYEHDNLAKDLFSQKKYADAEIEERAAIRLATSRASYHNKLGDILMAQDRWTEAEMEYREAVHLDVAEVLHRTHLAHALMSQNRFAEAEAVYREATRMEPRTANHYLWLGSALMKQKKYQGAEAAFRSALKFDPKDGLTHNQLGMALDCQEKNKEAEAEYRKAILYSPKVAAPHVNLAIILAITNRRAEAKKELQTALKLGDDGKNFIFRELGVHH